MKHYIYYINLWCVTVFTVAWMTSCSDDTFVQDGVTYNLRMNFMTRATTSADLISNLRIFAFKGEGSNDGYFRRELYNITRNRDASTVTADIEAGAWYLTLVSDPSGTAELTAPDIHSHMDNLPMYCYAPAVINGKSADASEIFVANQLTPSIQAGRQEHMNAQLNRAAAKVELVLGKVNHNFKTSSATHVLELHDVPSTISYTGKILPDRFQPYTLDYPLQASVSLRPSAEYPGFLEAADTISFIIPAHQGSDFLSESPGDTITTRMRLAVDLERTGGSRFVRTMEIPYVAKCNTILRVQISVNEGLDIKTEILPWDEVSIRETVGAGYSNWLYVKKGATGLGTSWSDPLPDITTAIDKAGKLADAGYVVNGILVAGGEHYIYTESFAVTAAAKAVYGGWEGTPGTELPSSDKDAPYKSSDRKLNTHKVRLEGGGVQLAEAFVTLDGFVLNGAPEQYDGLLHIAHDGAMANAIEISGNKQISAGKYALKMDAGTALNILSANNSMGVYVASGATLVNATVAKDGVCDFSGTVINSVIGWNGQPVSVGENAVLTNCAYLQGTSVPAGLLAATLKINTSNEAWFVPGTLCPGPHFNLNGDASKAMYAVGTKNPDRSPLLGRGSQSGFDDLTPFMPETHKTDIVGNPRHHLGTDIGCYESTDYKGFKIEWATNRIYVSSKGGYSSEHPLRIPGNDAYGITLNWSATPIGQLAHTSLDPNRRSGTGTGVVVGIIGFKNDGLTPLGDYTGSSARKCGEIQLSTDLGLYLPDTRIEVWQTPGASSAWSEGYVGSFHKNNERGARYISGQNTYINSGTSYGTYQYWSARIINGLDWIKIDGHGRDYGENIIDEPLDPSIGRSGYYKEVEETHEGVVDGEGVIKFRVGMRSKNTTGKPRYGLIIVTRGNVKGADEGSVSMFFVRQGEDDDYLYRPGPDGDPRTANPEGRNNAKRLSVYQVGDPQLRTRNIDVTSATDPGYSLSTNGGSFMSHPTKIGYFFQRNRSIPFLRGRQTSNLPTQSVTTDTNAWNPYYEVCPSGYRHIDFSELMESCYLNVPYTPDFYYAGPWDDEVLRNFVWGRYADGYYDQQAPDPVPSTPGWNVDRSIEGIGFDAVGTPPHVAMRGVLMVNHYNYAAVFFPQSGTMLYNSTPHYGNSYFTDWQGIDVASTTVMFSTRNWTTNRKGNTHWMPGHVGVGCGADLLHTSATPVRCVRDE